MTFALLIIAAIVVGASIGWFVLGPLMYDGKMFTNPTTGERYFSRRAKAR